MQGSSRLARLQGSERVVPSYVSQLTSKSLVMSKRVRCAMASLFMLKASRVFHCLRSDIRVRERGLYLSQRCFSSDRPAGPICHPMRFHDLHLRSTERQKANRISAARSEQYERRNRSGNTFAKRTDSAVGHSVAITPSALLCYTC